MYQSLFFSDRCIKQIDSTLPRVCSVIDHRRHQNVVKTSVTHSPVALVPPRCFDHILTSSVIYYWTDTRQHGIYALNGGILQAASSGFPKAQWGARNKREARQLETSEKRLREDEGNQYPPKIDRERVGTRQYERIMYRAYKKKYKGREKNRKFHTKVLFLCLLLSVTGTHTS